MANFESVGTAVTEFVIAKFSGSVSNSSNLGDNSRIDYQQKTNSNNNYFNQLFLNANGGAGARISVRFPGHLPNNASGQIHLATNNSGSAPVTNFIMFESGNIRVGGTSDNGVKFQVTGGIDITGTMNSFNIGTGTIQSTFLFTNGMEANTGNMAIRTNLGSSRTISFGEAATNLGANEYMRFFPSNTIPGIGTGSTELINIQPTINQTTGTGTIYGIRFKPVNTAVLSTVYSFYADSGIAYFGGNVGIGTTSPSNTLDVNGSLRSTTSQFDNSAQVGKADNTSSYPTLGLRYASGTGADIQGYNGGSGSVKIRMATTSLFINTPGNMIFCNAVNETNESMRIVSGTKNVLIGTTTDGGQRLQVTGAIRQNFSATRYIDISSAGTYGQGVYVNALGSLEFAQLSLRQGGSQGLEINSYGEIKTFNNDLWYTGYAGLENLRCNFYAGVVVNEGGRNDVYFRVEGDTNVNLFYTAPASDNIGMGTNTPNASALLDVSSTTKGFLPPRMTNAQMVAIATPAAGLVVYDTTNNKLSVYDGSTWIAVH
jgi:hypothetical protein